MDTLHNHLLRKNRIYEKWHANKVLCNIVHWSVFLGISVICGTFFIQFTQNFVRNYPGDVSFIASTTRASTPKWVSGYYVGWDTINYPPSAIDFSSLSHIMVFAVLPNSNGTLNTNMYIDSVSGPRMAQDVAVRAHASSKKAILTVGGYPFQREFQGATNSTNINAFVGNLINLVNSWGYDGIDIDWEPLSPSDYPAIVSLLNKLKTAKPEMILTIDMSWQNINSPMTATDVQYVRDVSAIVDQMNIMTYEMADNWGGWVSWHASALNGAGSDHPSSVASSVNAYLNAGIPAYKIGIGIGFFGSCWNSPTTAPLQQLGTSHVVAGDDTMSFANIKNLYFNANNYRYDASADAPYLSFASPTGGSQCTFISYEDETSVAAKGRYADQTGIGGTILWQLNEGYNKSAADPNSLLHAVRDAFLSVGIPDTVAPTVSVTAPVTGSTVSEFTTVTASANDNIAVVGVQFRVDGVNIGAEDQSSPYEVSWDTTKVSNSSHILTAVGRDAAGNTATSTDVIVTVSNTQDRTPPTVSITSPTGGTVAKKGVVNIAANASDNIGVTKVEFYVNKILTCTDVSSPYSCSWKVPAGPNRTYELQAKAYDVAGNFATTSVSVVSK